jgi:peptidoglycan L-alanyl-D-glutamate endopeptidase CwlK
MPSTSLQDADKELRDAYLALRTEYQAANPARSLVVTCSYRSPEEQMAAYQQGRGLEDGKWRVQDISKVVTQLSGKPGSESNHNLKPCRAIDVAVCIGGKATWDIKEYAPLGPLAAKHGLVWGGNWTTLKDFPHLELPKEGSHA